MTPDPLQDETHPPLAEVEKPVGWVRLDRSEHHFMCCICFDWTLYTEAYEDAAGVRWDMCPMCGSREAVVERRFAAGDSNDERS